MNQKQFHKDFDWLYLGMTANLRLDERKIFERWWDKVGKYISSRVKRKNAIRKM